MSPFVTCHCICFLQRCSETRGVLQSQPAAEGTKQNPAGCHQSPGRKVTSSSTKVDFVATMCDKDQQLCTLFPDSVQGSVIDVPSWGTAWKLIRIRICASSPNWVSLLVLLIIPLSDRAVTNCISAQSKREKEFMFCLFKYRKACVD